MIFRRSIQEINYNYVGWLTWRCVSLFYLYQFILRVFTGVMAQDIMLSLHLTLMQTLVELLRGRDDTQKILIRSIFSCILGNLCMGYLFFPPSFPHPILRELTVTLALGFVVSFFVKEAYFLFFEQKSWPFLLKYFT